MAAIFIDNLRDIIDLAPQPFQRRLNMYTNLINDPGAGGFNDPEKCLQVFKLIELFQDKYLPKIKANAIAQKILNGDALPKGFITPGHAFKPEVSNVKIGAYFKHFCDNDPLVYNHNGTTNITNIDRTTGAIAIDATGQPGSWILGVGVGPPAPQDIPAFIAYFTSAVSTPPEVVDALSYLWNPAEQEEVCSKYKMPSVLFTVDGMGAVEIVNAPAPGAIVTGPSRAVNRFSNGGELTAGTNVFPGGKDYRNLTQIGMLRGSNSFRLGNSSPLPIDKYNSYFTFPNFLLGNMLYMSLDAFGRPRNPATYVFRPFVDSSSQNDMEFWVKNYDTGDASFPYDQEKYVLPAGWKMIERADGIIMYLSPANHLNSDPPDGSYYIKKPGIDIARVIKSTDAYTAMVNAVNAAITNGDGAAGGGAPYTAVQMGNPVVQNKLKLVAYMTNIDHLRRHGVTGGNKKKTKRKNIIKHVAKSKKKHNHK